FPHSPIHVSSLVSPLTFLLFPLLSFLFFFLNFHLIFLLDLLLTLLPLRLLCDYLFYSSFAIVNPSKGEGREN
ncbi:hypothetical protein ERO13_D07G128950v2, partial [Gossypium hirsutum]